MLTLVNTLDAWSRLTKSKDSGDMNFSLNEIIPKASATRTPQE